MNNLICYRSLAIWDCFSLPEVFLKKHNTKIGTWAKLTIFSGSLNFAFLNKEGEVIKVKTFNKDNQPPFIEPQQWHRIISISDDIRCQLSFYCEKEHYYEKKYGLKPVHSEIKAAVNLIEPGKALDLGCGRGRNSLFLNQNGFDLTAWDKDNKNIEQLQEIIQKESLINICAEIKNINYLSYGEKFDFIFSTVVFMFLEADRIPFIIQNMQECTNKGGYNLIVSAMNSDDYPCRLPFSFTFSPDELKSYYQEWELRKYNEDVGELHKLDENGNRIKLRFATILARKK